MIPITSTLISTLASFTFLPLLSKGVHFIVLVKGFIYLFVWLDICCHTKVSWRDCEEVVPGGEIARKLCIEQTYKSCCAVTDYLPCIEREWDLNKPNVLLSQRIWALPDCFDTCILCEVLVYLLFYEHNASISSCSKKKKWLAFLFCVIATKKYVLSSVERVAGALSCAVLWCLFVSAWSELAWEKHAMEQSDSELEMMSSFWGYSDRRVAITFKFQWLQRLQNLSSNLVSSCAKEGGHCCHCQLQDMLWQEMRGI